MKLVIKDAIEYRVSYETAAWYTIHIIQPGEYEVVDKGLGCYRRPYMIAEVKTIIKEHYTPSLYCGVRIGDYEDTMAGKESSVILSSDYYAFDEGNKLEQYGELIE